MRLRPLCTLIFLAAALIWAHGTSNAEVINFADLQLNQGASLQGSVLRLTPAAPFSFGSAFVKKPVEIRTGFAFSSFFQFQISGGTGGDGFVFVLHSNPEGAQALGGFGGDLGYHDSARPPGVSPSIAVEFDTFQNPFDPAGEHVGIDTNGSTTSLVTAPAVLSGSSRFAWVDYAHGVLNVFLSETSDKPSTPLLFAAVDVPGIVGPQSFIGFTASTGGSTNNHDILEWSWTVVPEPSTFPLCAAGLAMLAGYSLWARRRTRPRSREAWLPPSGDTR